LVLGLSLRDSSRESCGRVPGARGGCEYPDELVLGREYVALWCVCVVLCGGGEANVYSIYMYVQGSLFWLFGKVSVHLVF
jgi:hypothetical protein